MFPWACGASIPAMWLKPPANVLRQAAADAQASLRKTSGGEAQTWVFFFYCFPSDSNENARLRITDVKWCFSIAEVHTKYLGVLLKLGFWWGLKSYWPTKQVMLLYRWPLSRLLSSQTSERLSTLYLADLQFRPRFFQLKNLSSWALWYSAPYRMNSST